MTCALPSVNVLVHVQYTTVQLIDPCVQRSTNERQDRDARSNPVQCKSRNGREKGSREEGRGGKRKDRKEEGWTRTRSSDTGCIRLAAFFPPHLGAIHMGAKAQKSELLFLVNKKNSWEYPKFPKKLFFEGDAPVRRTMILKPA